MIRTGTLESEAGFRALFEYASIGILVAGANGKIALVNSRMAQLFGYPEEEMTGMTVEELIPRQFRDQHVRYREQYVKKPRPRPMGLGMDLHGQRKDGSVFPVEVSLGHYQLEGQLVAVAFVTDISERKQAEDELHRLNEDLESRVKERTEELVHALDREKSLSEMKSHFVSIASHEFRTPLSAILSSVSLIARYTSGEEQPKRDKHIERIRSSVKSLTATLNDFLSLDKLEQGKVEKEDQWFSLPELASDTVEELQGTLKEGQIVEQAHEGQEKVLLDRKIVRNILLNLLSNAAKYSPAGNKIALRTRTSDATVLLEVQDWGMGIPEAEQSQLFHRFFRAKNATGTQGTGLGLNIVHRYVGLLNGTITFESAEGAGSTFTVEFPNYAN